jgi:hypothetical protein
MTRTVTRLFDHHSEAVQAVEALERAGVDHDRISLVSNDAEGKLGKSDDHDHTGEDAGKGAVTGGALGAGAGLLAGLGMLAIPGLGPVVAAGWLASTGLSAAIGAVAGGVSGGLIGALKDAGHSQEDAEVYSEGVRRGGSLVSVKADDHDADRIETLLNQSRGVTATDRGDAYRSGGWTGYDDNAAPYSVDEMAQERGRYGENRAFGVDQERDHDGLTDSRKTRADQTFGREPGAARPL